jgi:hypothetical protein
MKQKTPIYKEDTPHKGFMLYIRKWLKDRNVEPICLLVSKPNLVIAVIDNNFNKSLICFYIQKLCALGTGGVIVYYDVSTMSVHLKSLVENTFTNWIAQAHLC